MKIKFRIWHRKFKQMQNWEGISFKPDILRKCTSNGTAEPHYHMVDLIEGLEKEGDVMLYFGMDDCNGREIYEGDILRSVIDGQEVIGVVAYDPKRFTFGVNAEVDVVPKGIKDGHIVVTVGKNSKNKKPEVIGNFYENPELITKISK